MGNLREGICYHYLRHFNLVVELKKKTCFSSKNVELLNDDSNLLIFVFILSWSF